MILLNLLMKFLSGRKIFSRIKLNKDIFLMYRTMNQNPTFRRFWTSKLTIDANNFDFSQGESCLRTDLSWHIGLREHSVQFVLILNKLLSSITDENLLSTQIRSLRRLQNISVFEKESLMVNLVFF